MGLLGPPRTQRDKTAEADLNSDSEGQPQNEVATASPLWTEEQHSAHDGIHWTHNTPHTGNKRLSKLVGPCSVLTSPCGEVNAEISVPALNPNKSFSSTRLQTTCSTAATARRLMAFARAEQAHCKLKREFQQRDERRQFVHAQKSRRDTLSQQLAQRREKLGNTWAAERSAAMQERKEVIKVRGDMEARTKRVVDKSEWDTEKH
eukprot:GHVT01038108.1.p4 GENE.GHVT01038108.1~~GHVT01038108.1.p4  ORF type:complete len:205 (+),score=31.75 GHVT01038108.1:8110-8724(+)